MTTSPQRGESYVCRVDVRGTDKQGRVIAKSGYGCHVYPPEVFQRMYTRRDPWKNRARHAGGVLKKLVAAADAWDAASTHSEMIAAQERIMGAVRLARKVLAKVGEVAE